ncbi:MAG: DUF1772 domain-containing protein [Pseudonocardia sp.]
MTTSSTVTPTPLTPMTLAAGAAAIGTAAVGGLCYAFSTLVMGGLDRIEPVQAITAIRGINAEASANPPFLLLFFVPSLLSLGVGAGALRQLGRPGSGLLLAGAVFGMVSTVVTIAIHLPLNDQIDAVNPEGLSAADAAREWASYLDPWMAWNHVRSGSGFVAAALLLLGLRHR